MNKKFNNENFGIKFSIFSGVGFKLFLLLYSFENRLKYDEKFVKIYEKKLWECC